MVSRRGATRRKKVPKPILPEEPPLEVDCVCCHCGSLFSPFDVAGTYLKRTCPECGESLSEREYDAKVSSLVSERNDLREKINQWGEALGERKKWKRRLKWVPNRWFRELLNERVAYARLRKRGLEEEMRQRVKSYEVMAPSRYYASEWFARTHIPLERKVLDPYKVGVSYDSDGVWHMHRGDGHAQGLQAEYGVFQALMKRVSDSHSILYQAQILPNIYLLREQQGQREHSFWTQVDCVLLTRQAAFVLEVKHRSGRILAPSPFCQIWSTDSSDLIDAYFNNECGCSLREAGFRDESLALRQNATHAEVFASDCEVYPFERVYEQVVFFKPRSFSAESETFINNANVSCCEHGADRFVGVIEGECAKLDDLLTQEELDDLGESLLRQYGDLNQKRGLLHVERIRALNRQNATRGVDEGSLAGEAGRAVAALPAATSDRGAFSRTLSPGPEGARPSSRG